MFTCDLLNTTVQSRSGSSLTLNIRTVIWKICGINASLFRSIVVRGLALTHNIDIEAIACVLVRLYVMYCY